ncbi:hypothetical protein [Sphingobacterium sp.]|uniref:hypothetical protein n=1 Tax=Sphingobacterium sp. TaxID=341027 RepID=UPI0031CEAE69
MTKPINSDSRRFAAFPMMIASIVMFMAMFVHTKLSLASSTEYPKDTVRTIYKPQLFDSIIVKSVYQDTYGKNTLYIKVTNPCNADSSRFDGVLTQIEARVKNKNTAISMVYTHPYPQMSLIYFVKEEIHLQNFGNHMAVIIPFYYCGGYETNDMKVSYIVIYRNNNYIFHINYYCGEGKDCKPVQSFKVMFSQLPKDIRNYLNNYLTQKHKSRFSFHQE